MKIILKKKFKKVNYENYIAEIVGIWDNNILLRFKDSLHPYSWNSTINDFEYYEKNKVVFYITKKSFLNQNYSYYWVDKSEVNSDIISIKIN